MVQRPSNIWPTSALALALLLAGASTALAEQPNPAAPDQQPAQNPAAGESPDQAQPDDNLTEDERLLQMAETEGEVIVVTAQKREERIVDVPFAITALSGDTIDKSFSHNLESLPRLVPTLTFRKGTTTRNSALILRGIGTISFSIAAEPSVATVIDGVVYARSGQAFSDLLDVERVEVLRGPQGTLFGKNASSGVINFTTRRPLDKFEAEVSMSAFSDDEYRTRGIISGPLSKDLRGRLTAFYGSFDGYVDNIALDEKVNGYSRQGVRSLLEWVPPLSGVNLNLTFIADYSRGDDDCCAELLELAGEPGELTPVVQEALGPRASQGPEELTVSQNLRSRTMDETGGASLQADLEVADHIITSITAYREWDNTEIRDGDFLDVGASHVGLFELHDVGIQEFRQFSQELRVTSPAGRRVEYQAGLYYFHLESDRQFTREDVICPETTLMPDDTGASPCLTGLSIIQRPAATATMGSEFDNFAAFGQATVRVVDKLKVTGGLRFTRDDLSYFHSRVNLTGVAGPGVRLDDFPGPELNMGDQFTGQTDENGFSGRGIVAYQVLEDLNVFGSYARGYKGPAFNIFFNFTENNRLPIAAETSNAFELGFKGALMDGNIYASGTGFYQQFDNFQANNFIELDGTVITTLTNAGTVSTKGFELEVNGRPVPALSVNAGLAYIDAQIDEFNVIEDDPEADDRAGEELPLSPDFKVSLGADYLISKTPLPWNISLGSKVSWQSEQFSNFGEDEDLKIDPYAMWDADVTVMSKDDRISLTFLVRNILDEHFSTLITRGGPAGSLRHQVPRDAKRFFGLSLNAKM